MEKLHVSVPPYSVCGKWDQRAALQIFDLVVQKYTLFPTAMPSMLPCTEARGLGPVLVMLKNRRRKPND
jgi:hypothetical protein